MDYKIKALCWSFKCKGEERIFQRDTWQDPITENTPMGRRIESGPLARAYCTDCGMYAHVALTPEEIVQKGSEYSPGLHFAHIEPDPVVLEEIQEKLSK